MEGVEGVEEVEEGGCIQAVVMARVGACRGVCAG